MSYVTVQAMIEKFGERELVDLTDNEQPYTDTINQQKLEAAIESANSEIDGYISGRYSLPLAVVPPFLKAVGCDMAYYHACLGDTVLNERAKLRYDNAIKILTNIAKGMLNLGGSPAGESKPTQTSSNNVVFGVGRRDFGGGGFGNGGW